ncbi:MAG: hypothetical protein HBSAPP03_28150 [Phycisphaerae bacterium]|nr:MAG: hypothetical protein HBSAPP03_28150 [Phycisphaerae bacterium]
MTLTDFLQHWSLTENPFKGEEARADEVFSRLCGDVPAEGVTQAATVTRSGEFRHVPAGGTYHADFEKILGDLRRPSCAVVFGEKGSGKTAIRIQIARRVEAFNAANPGAKVLCVAYDDLNQALDQLHDRLGSKAAIESLQKMRLVDHVDAVMGQVVPRLVDAVLLEGEASRRIPLGEQGKLHKRLDVMTRRDLLLLQALYDRPDDAARRTARLRSRLRLMPPGSAIWGRLTIIILPLLIVAGWWWGKRWVESRPADATPFIDPQWVTWALAGVAGLYALFALKIGVWDRLALLRQAHRVRRQVRVIGRGDISFAGSLRQLPRWFRDLAHLPVTDSEDPRFEMFERLRRVLRPFGYAGVVLVIDRVDEPTIVNGDPERMKAVVWPLLSNKFLQLDGLGVKMLLPMELRHAVFKESNAFFQSARLDKQSMIERLTWTGQTLYDLCEARLNACRAPGSPHLPLLDLFAQDVTRQELIEGLERLHQPRDAFKMLYRCIGDHCASLTRGEAQWRIPQHVLANVLKSESERVQAMHRGIRPA